MGKKGDKLTSVSSLSAENLQQNLSDLGDIHLRKMFGGHGVFEAGTMFALVDKSGDIFFKVDETNLKMYEEAGARKHGRMPYYQIPEEALTDENTLKKWAEISILIAKKAI